MNMTTHSPNVSNFEVLPKTEIKIYSAIGIDADGNAHELQPGETFRGFAAQRRDPLEDKTRLGVLVAFEGIEQLVVEGFRRGDVGKKVYATSPHTFTINPPKGAKVSPIGHAVAYGDYNRAIVKFYSAKI
jgi:hypothetical protein